MHHRHDGHLDPGSIRYRVQGWDDGHGWIEDAQEPKRTIPPLGFLRKDDMERARKIFTVWEVWGEMGRNGITFAIHGTRTFVTMDSKGMTKVLNMKWHSAGAT